MSLPVRLLPWLGLLLMGVLWGLSFSFTRMAVENGGTPLGIAFWQTIISSVILLSFSSLRGRHFTLRPHHIGPFIIIALLGVALPGVAFYIAASRVPSGVLAITVTLVPILTYCMALGLRIEAFSMIRISGIVRHDCHPAACPANQQPAGRRRDPMGPARLSEFAVLCRREHLPGPPDNQ